MSTTTQNDWAERFDKEFPNLRMYYSDGLAPCEDDVKAFIAKELADAKKAVLETIPNPSYSQAEVDRLVADARKEVIEEVEKLPSLAHSMA